MVTSLRGAWTVLVHVVSAADHYLTARLGHPPLAWLARRVGARLREAYRLDRHEPSSTCTDLAVIVYDGEIIEEHNPNE